MNDDELTLLRRAVDALPAGRSRRYSAALRIRVESAMRRARAAGWSQMRFAIAVGIPAETLSKWRAAPLSTQADLVRVHIRDDADSDAATTTEGGSLSLVSPSGYRVEGLRRDDVVALLQALA